MVGVETDKWPLELAPLDRWAASVQWVRQGRKSFDSKAQIAKFGVPIVTPIAEGVCEGCFEKILRN